MFNFLYSLPQLFHLIPCPRHRLPKLNPETGLLQMSVTEFQPNRLSLLGRLSFSILSTLHLVHWREVDKEGEGRWVQMNNLTILNLLLIKCSGRGGEMHEWSLAKLFFALQCACSIAAFIARFHCAQWLYDRVQ